MWRTFRDVCSIVESACSVFIGWVPARKAISGANKIKCEQDARMHAHTCINKECSFNEYFGIDRSSTHTNRLNKHTSADTYTRTSCRICRCYSRMQLIHNTLNHIITPANHRTSISRSKSHSRARTQNQSRAQNNTPKRPSTQVTSTIWACSSYFRNVPHDTSLADCKIGQPTHVTTKLQQLLCARTA